jgi:hypothetical protein
MSLLEKTCFYICKNLNYFVAHMNDNPHEQQAAGDVDEN